MKLPNFLIVGVPKAGTTSVYYWLNQHPQVYMSPIKEPHYFSQIGNEDHVNSWEDYVKLFSDVNTEHLAIGEASTSYFHFYKRAIPLIKKHLGSPKIIVILRNPVERAWSHYMYYRKLGRESNSVNIIVTNSYTCKEEPWGIKNPYIELSFYSEALEAYLDSFANVKVMFYDDLKHRPHDFIKELYEFLDVDSDFMPGFEVRNISGEPRNKLIGFLLSNSLSQKIIPRIPYVIKAPFRKILLKKKDMPKEIKRELLNIYLEDIEKVEKLLGVNLEHWKS
ncbi:sulfotransferase [Thermovibrio ammonificans HB-1]|uniref:Sulfotransferase n=1 Tax=Thermovibrio ammonificans (strain DSM 15698 / JCM 12110 / HB-1) TaxID=648996 RepID=E8T653_THEA1|nr:sulfotransferase [Thermovibrio ammonificans]ADU96637.1 sulfotransferase [Thermovibrio ammonificans HB-1]